MKPVKRDELRRQFRDERKRIDPRTQFLSAQRLARLLTKQHFYRAARRIAAYFDCDGEISPTPVIEHAWLTGREVYLPVIGKKKRLTFARYSPDTELEVNRYGIPEPESDKTQIIDARHLDLVLMPLVAFDAKANRLGMGGGYYDRTFSFLRNRTQWHHPKLIGLAFEQQKTAYLTQEYWDIRPWRIVTETCIYPETELL